MARTSKSFPLVVNAPAVAGEPAWFAALPSRTWTLVGSNSASSVGYTAGSQPQVTSGLAYSGLDPNFFRPFSGATADQARREVLMVANGGHSDYLGNEGYALALWADPAPYWYRLNDASPGSVIYPASQNSNIVNGTSQFYDGRSTSMHTYGIQTYANGKVWYAAQGHQTGGAGSWVSGIVAYDRNSMRTSNAGSPTAWANNAGPWTHHGAYNNSPHSVDSAASNTWSEGSCVYDSVGGYVYFINPQSAQLQYIKLNATTGAHNCYVQNSLGSAPSYVSQRVAPVFVNDRTFLSGTNGAILVFHRSSAQILVLSAPLMGSAGNWAYKTATGTVPPFGDTGGSCVYHNGAVYYMNWVEHGSKVFKLTLPTDMVNGPYVWSVEAAEGSANAPATGSYAGYKQWTKFQIIRDMAGNGSGRACLVCCHNWSGQTSVYRLT